MRRIFTAVLLLIVMAVLLPAVTAGPACAQYGPGGDWNRTTDTMAGALGAHFGKLGGHGLAFRYPLTWYLYLQVAGGVWHTADNKHHNTGFQLDYILRQDQRLRLYVTGGAAYFYHKEKVGGGDPEVWNLEEGWNTGGGVGVEFLQGQRWSLQFEADFVHDANHDETKLVPQVGIYYYW